MGLCPHNYSGSLVCDTLDDYMRRLCNDELASALDSLCFLARRIMDRINRKPGAPFWSVSGALVITRQSWQEFCSKVEGLAELVVADCTFGGAPRNLAATATASAARLDRRPGLLALRAAAERTSDLVRKATRV